MPCGFFDGMEQDIGMQGRGEKWITGYLLLQE